jgi:hypothetical protein
MRSECGGIFEINIMFYPILEGLEEGVAEGMDFVMFLAPPFDQERTDPIVLHDHLFRNVPFKFVVFDKYRSLAVPKAIEIGAIPFCYRKRKQFQIDEFIHNTTFKICQTFGRFLDHA